MHVNSAETRAASTTRSQREPDSRPNLVADAFHTWAYRKGRDLTEAFARRSTLVLAPHPDDETLACGATILHKRARGTRVHIVIATDGAAANVVWA